MLNTSLKLNTALKIEFMTGGFTLTIKTFFKRSELTAIQIFLQMIGINSVFHANNH